MRTWLHAHAGSFLMLSSTSLLGKLPHGLNDTVCVCVFVCVCLGFHVYLIHVCLAGTGDNVFKPAEGKCVEQSLSS